MATPLKVDAVYLWILTEEDGSEGIPAIQVSGMWYPAVGADAARILSLRPAVEALAKARNLPLRLVRAASLETINPEDLRKKLT